MKAEVAQALHEIANEYAQLANIHSTTSMWIIVDDLRKRANQNSQEQAANNIAAQVLRDAADDLGDGEKGPSIYAHWLRTRADRIEAGGPREAFGESLLRSAAGEREAK